MALAAGEQDLLRFLCSVRVPNNACSDQPPMKCILTQLPPPVGYSELVSASIVRGPSLSLGVAFPSIRSHVASLSELVTLSRTELQSLATNCGLSIAQSMALFSHVSSMLETLPVPCADTVEYEEASLIVAAPCDVSKPMLRVLCRDCNPATFHPTPQFTLPINNEDFSTLVPRPPMSAARDSLRRNTDLTAAVETRWSLKTQLCSSLFLRKYRHILPEGDPQVVRVQWIHLHAMLKEEEVTPRHLMIALEWWKQCLTRTIETLSAMRPPKKARSKRQKVPSVPPFRGPTVAQLLSSLDKGVSEGVRAVLSHYRPHGGPHVVELDASVMRSPSNRLRDASFWKLFEASKSLPGVPGVVSQMLLEREWKFNPQLAFPFLGYIIAVAPHCSFVDATEVQKPVSPRRRGGTPRRPLPAIGVAPLRSPLVQ